MAQQQGSTGHRPAVGQLAFEGFVGLCLPVPVATGSEGSVCCAGQPVPEVQGLTKFRRMTVQKRSSHLSSGTMFI